MIKLNQESAATKSQILIVEDERIIAINLKESLESIGYSVVGIADSGEEAVEKATQFCPDLVLMDIRLQGNMDGIVAAQKIWDNLSIPAIYVTGHSDKSTLERAKVTAPFGYILKPIKEQELYVAIEASLQRYEREQLLSAILKGMGDGVIVVDTESRIQFLNQVAEFLTGWKLGEVRDWKLTEVFKIVDEQTHQPVDNPVMNILAENTNVYLNESILLICKNGTTIPITNSAAPVKNKKGNLAGVVLVFRDITQQRLAEERNLAMERARDLEIHMAELQRLNQLKDDFLHTISHELRSPLANIKMAARLLEIAMDERGLLSTETLVNSQSMAYYLNILQDQCNQELNLVNDLLEMRAIDADAYPLELTPINLPEWIPHIIEGFEIRTQAQQQSLQLNFSSELSLFISDLPSLTRILSELLNNACKYTPPGENIVINVESFFYETLALDYVKMSISNSGIEISTEEQSQIFEPFYRIPRNRFKHDGTGLGLALVKKIVHRLQGKIEVSSTQGWTTFTVQLPNLASSLQAGTDDC